MKKGALSVAFLDQSKHLFALKSGTYPGSWHTVLEQKAHCIFLVFLLY